MKPATVAAWLAELAEQRRQSPHTIKAYGRDLEQLLQLSGDLPWSGMTPAHIRRYAAQLHAGGLNGRTLGRMLSAWRGFFRWLGRRGEVVSNPCEGIRAPKVAKPLPRALGVDETARLLDTPPSDAVLDLRDQAMFELFYSSGLRLSELAGLNQEDLRTALEEAEIRVLGKRSKMRVVPVGHLARQALARWGERRG
ncbi:MAG: tyrosine recombinase XerC, partial [Pseudomonadota bacterium]